MTLVTAATRVYDDVRGGYLLESGDDCDGQGNSIFFQFLLPVKTGLDWKKRKNSDFIVTENSRVHDSTSRSFSRINDFFLIPVHEIRGFFLPSCFPALPTGYQLYISSL